MDSCKDSQDVDDYVNKEYGDCKSPKQDKRSDIRTVSKNHFAYQDLLKAEKKYNARFNNDFYSFALDLNQDTKNLQTTALPKCPMISKPRGKWPVRMLPDFMAFLEKYSANKEANITIGEEELNILGLFVFSDLFYLPQFEDTVFICTDIYAIDWCNHCTRKHKCLKNFY